MSSISRGISRSETRDDGSQLNRSLNNLYNKKITMIRSCSEVMPRVDYSSWPGQLHTRSAVANEMPLIGECRYCDQSCRCSCCPCCDHLVIIYAPVCSKHSKKKLYFHILFFGVSFFIFCILFFNRLDNLSLKTVNSAFMECSFLLLLKSSYFKIDQNP